MFTPSQWRIVHYCAEEVYRQRDDARFVPHMLVAWAHAIRLTESQHDTLHLVECPHLLVTPAVLEQWGQMIAPYMNRLGMRSPENPTNVSVGDHQCPHYRDVPRLVTLFCESVREGKFLPAEAYKEFELIHPFRDGNGRTGKVLYNFLLGTLNEPRFPPNFFGGISNP